MQSLESEFREKLQSDLIAFTRFTYPRYEPGRVHRLMASKLEAVARGEIKRLILTLPPRHGKSELASVRFPAFYLGRNPAHYVILTSYGAELARGFGAQVKELVGGEEFGLVFPGVALNATRRKQNLWRVTAPHGQGGGGMNTAGVGGGVTGFGAHLLAVDDPFKNNVEANSEGRRTLVSEWFKSVAYTRLERGGAITLTQTRWNKSDLAGEKIAAMLDGGGEKWDWVDLPAIAENDEDWGRFGVRAKGTALWPEKYDLDALKQIRREIGEYWFAALYQQRPRPLEGNIINVAGIFWIAENAVPPLIRQCRFWDLAFSVREKSDFAAGARCGVDNAGRFYIQDMKRSRGEWPKHYRTILATAEADGPGVEVIIEANGTQLGYYQQVRDALRSRIVRKGIPEGNKEMRAGLWGSRIEDGIIFGVRGAWNTNFTGEAEDFPNAEHDDQVDAVSGAWRRLTARAGTITSE